MTPLTPHEAPGAMPSPGVQPIGPAAELVLIPGLLNDADLWRDQVEGLADAARIRVAGIAHGETIEDLARGILAEAGPQVSVAGFSLGGYVAQEMARLAPARIERLALLDTGFRADTPERAQARKAMNDTAGLPGRFHGFGRRLFASYLHPAHRDDERIVGRIRGMTERLGPEVFVRQNSVERKDGSDVLRSLACPVLILCGEHDEITPPAEHREMARLVPHARLVVVPNSGHMTPIENPEAVTRELRAWLGDGPRTAAFGSSGD